MHPDSKYVLTLSTIEQPIDKGEDAVEESDDESNSDSSLPSATSNLATTVAPPRHISKTHELQAEIRKLREGE